MITRELLKDEIEKVRDDYLDMLYQIIRVFEWPARTMMPPAPHNAGVLVLRERSEWYSFVQRTYGAFADDAIERGSEGQLEIREDIE